ncbi:MAG: DHH family phosphoesterase [Bacteroidia bacterium]
MQLVSDNTDGLIQELHGDTPLTIVVTTHHKPDGDAMGSSLALYTYLKGLKHKVTLITPTDYPRFLHWMPGHNEVLIYEGNEKKCKTIGEAADFIFCLDFNDLKRINEFGLIVGNSKAKKVMIDHHREPSGFDDFRYWTYEASSTSELIYEFIKKCGHTDRITPQIADCLYTGIMTDTGSFRYRGTSSNTHRTIAELIDKGAQNSAIHEMVYDSNTLLRLKMMGFVLYEKLEILPAYNTALVYLSKEELARFDIKTGDTEGFVNYGLSIEGIKLSVLIVDRTKLVKMSFRSKGDFACNEFARDHFAGGGHKNAAGGQSTETIETTISRFTEVLALYKDQLK